ncbi:hypothetical protein GCM10027347_55690 [Larkinella harenae]
MTLEKDLKEYSAKVQKVVSAIDNLRAAAVKLDKIEMASELGDTKESLKSDTFNLIIVGRFSNGKSTFVNALLGKPSNGYAVSNELGPIPVSPDPCTAILTRIRYAEKPYIFAWHFDGTREEWSLDRYLEEAQVRINKRQTEAAFSKIREFEMGYPSPLLKEGLTIIDSPGLDEDDKRTETTLKAIAKVDAAIVLFRSDALAGKGERSFVEDQLKYSGVKIFSVINLFNGREVNERFKGLTWYRLIGDATDQDYTGQDLGKYGIHFVDALKGFDGKWNANPPLMVDSGLSQFERVVSDFLTRDRVKVHLLRFIKLAENITKKLLEDLQQNQQVLSADVARIREAIDQSRPVLEKLKKRPTELERVFDFRERLLVDNLKNSFETLLRSLRESIPEYMDKVDLPLLKKTGNLITNRTGCEEEAKKACNDYIKSKIAEWGQQEAVTITESHMERLGAEVEVIVEKVDKDFKSIRLAIDAALDTNPEKKMISQGESIGAGVVGTILLDPGHALMGATFGWRGLAISLGGRIATAIGFVFLGLTGPVAVIAAILLGSIVSFIWGSETFGTRLRKSVADGFINGLQENLSGILSNLENEVVKEFREMRAPLLNKLQRQINQQIEQIRQIETDNERDQAEKSLKIKLLERNREDILVNQKVLNEVQLNI